MPKWTEIHTELQNLMKKEMEMMRNLLGNMHQEEAFILQHNKTYMQDLLKERGVLIANLSQIREEREKTAEKLELLENLPHTSLEHLLPPENENSWEIISLRDQIVALLNRINLQSSRNQMLTHLEAYQETPKKKIKISIATLPPDDYNDVA